MAGSWTYPPFTIYLWLEDVHERHDPRHWIHLPPAATGTKRARPSHSTWRKRSNKKRRAYSSRTVPRSLLGFIRSGMDWWFDWTTSTKNSSFLRRELSWTIPFWPFFFLNFRLPWILQIGFGTVSWVFVLQCTVSDICWVVIQDVVALTPCLGVSCGRIAEHAVER